MRGSIEKRGKGYRVTIFLGASEDGKPQRYRETVSTKKAAEAVLRAKLEEFETEGRIGTRTDDSLQAYIARYLGSTVAQRVKSRTLEYYRELFQLYIHGTELGRKPIKAVTVLDIEEHYAQLGQRVSADAVRRTHVLLSSAFKNAVRTREVASSPAIYVDLPKKEPGREMTLLRMEDFPAFLAVAIQDRLAAMWALAMSTGVRPEEYLGLRWDDIDGCTVSVNRVLVRARKLSEGRAPWELQTPKTKSSRRRIKIDEQIALMLRQHQAAQEVERQGAMKAYAGHGFVFCHELGEPLVHATVLRRFQSLAKKAGLPSGLTLYSMRHGAATTLLRKRESLKTVAGVLGHSSVKISGDVYCHLTEDLLDGAAAALAGAMFARERWVVYAA